jgi:hypothetical protein
MTFVAFFVVGLQLLDELYHEDKGFNHNSCVLLSERAPSNDVKHLLATHQATRKLSYLQGSPFRTEVCWCLVQLALSCVQHMTRMQHKPVLHGVTVW